MLTITAVEPGRTTGVLAMDVTTIKTVIMGGEHRYLPRRKP
jgi:hypothetical protein